MNRPLLVAVSSIILPLAGCQALIVFFPPEESEVWLEITDLQNGTSIKGASIQFAATDDLGDKSSEQFVSENGRSYGETSAEGCVDAEVVVETTHHSFLQACQGWPRYWLVRASTDDRNETILIDSGGGTCGAPFVTESSGDTIRVRATFAWMQGLTTECLPCSNALPHLAEGQTTDQLTPCLRQ